MKTLPLVLKSGQIKAGARRFVVYVPLSVVRPTHTRKEQRFNVGDKLGHFTPNKVKRSFALAASNNFADSAAEVLSNLILNVCPPLNTSLSASVFPVTHQVLLSPSTTPDSLACPACGSGFAVNYMFSGLAKARNRLENKTTSAPPLCDVRSKRGFHVPIHAETPKCAINRALGYTKFFSDKRRLVLGCVKLHNLLLVALTCSVVGLSHGAEKVQQSYPKLKVNNVAELTEETRSRLLRAIYLAEGGKKARSPYGVLSVKVRDEAHARRITLNSINNNWTRWEQAGRPGEFVKFMGLRWCPPSADPQGHINWVKNVTRIYNAK